ncbi:hypothetical protein MWT96_20165 [Prescottella equi]|uniref:phage tail fiber protein n=1 Tax=Rhodococcus hoagii TaxID=43767 RepID=UPI0019F9AC5C|nr:hypothetical protein [Prescottella equi]MBM4496319.1 hypothetical protein [Prescottella equi]MBM4554321.1 hypothetical protein [Prescottella equi]MBM4558190.1 hypothetical protein [Prescottella equi]MBM4607718.1 hypothetical protein [Prescottella equi]MBM4644227.1 hypothetical protein [Prescottella equi]
MPITNPATRESAALHISSLGSWISFHTTDPGTTGGNEASGGGYARKQTTWTGGAADGTVTGSQVTIDVPAGAWAWCGIWSAQNGGTFVEKFSVNSNTLSAAGQIIVTPTITVS